LLEAGGLVSGNTTQSPEAVRTILLVMTLGTLTLLAIGWMVSLHFRLDRNTHEVLMNEIRRFKEQSSTGEWGTVPDAESRRIVEDLSGWRYEQLWGRAKATQAATVPSHARQAPTAPES
jgi:oligogalacturonide transporter